LLAYCEHPRALLLSKMVVNVILIYRVRAGDDLHYYAGVRLL